MVAVFELWLACLLRRVASTKGQAQLWVLSKLHSEEDTDSSSHLKTTRATRIWSDGICTFPCLYFFG